MSSFPPLEVEASDRSAIDAVLSADKKRLALIEEEKALVACPDANTERLKQVWVGFWVWLNWAFHVQKYAGVRRAPGHWC